MMDLHAQDQMRSLTTRIRYFTEAIDEASDHVQTPNDVDQDAMNKIITFTEVIRETIAEVERLLSTGAIIGTSAEARHG